MGTIKEVVEIFDITPRTVAQEQERPDVKAKREDFIDSVNDINPETLIFIDESGANLGMITDYARAEGGERAKMPKPFNAGEKFSIIGAIALTGIVAMMYIASAVNTAIFKTFVAKLLTPKALLYAITSVNDEDFEEWYDACGYSFGTVHHQQNRRSRSSEYAVVIIPSLLYRYPQPSMALLHPCVLI
jgi:hypothetical protein